MTDKQLERNERQKLCERLGISSDYRDKTLDNFELETDEQREVIKWARDYVEHIATTRTNAILCGAVGTGKTHIGCAITQACAERLGAFYVEWTASWKERSRYAPLSKILADVKRSYGKQSKTSEREIVDSLTEPRCLVIDEIGVQRGSDFELNLLDEIIDTRYSNGRSTVLLSNLMPKLVKDLLGDRIIDRLRHHGCKVFYLSGRSYRETHDA